MVETEGNGEEISGGIAAADMGEDGSMMCSKHPSGGGGGGICAVCLQEKLGNLVSSSLPIALFPSSSFSSSVRSESFSTTNKAHGSERKQQPPRIPFLYSASTTAANAMLQRSKSTVAQQESRRTRSFWSFLFYSKNKDTTPAAAVITATRASSVRQGIIDDEEEEDATPSCRVSRSRSVGCGGGGGGSRSFSGDFFERLGDCTIRRVESQRQQYSNSNNVDHGGHKGNNMSMMKERVRCGGIFNLASSSSSNSSSSSHWVPADQLEAHGTTAVVQGTGRSSSRSSSTSWAAWPWALASPFRAFAKPTPTRATSTSTSTSNNHNHNNAASNLPVPSPSLLSVSG